MWTPILWISSRFAHISSHSKSSKNHADLLIHEGVPGRPQRGLESGCTCTADVCHAPHPLPLTPLLSSLNQTGWDASRYALGLTDEFQGTGVFKWIKAKRSEGDGDLGAYYDDDKECVEAETKPETPPPKCDKDDGKGERRLSAVAAKDVDEEWHAQWRNNFSCWWLALPMPTQGQLGACMGALALFVGSKLDVAWRGAQTALGRSAGAAAGGGAAESAACESRVDALLNRGSLQLPSFPEFPNDLKFTPPPIPRLMPTWERMMSLVEDSKVTVLAQEPMPQPEPQPRFSNGVDYTMPAVLGAGAGAGLAIGALAAFALSSRRRIQVRSSHGVRESN